MGCYDSFNFEKDFSFQNCKDDFVIIPRGVYQTKDLKSILDTLEILYQDFFLLFLYKCHLQVFSI